MQGAGVWNRLRRPDRGLKGVPIPLQPSRNRFPVCGNEFRPSRSHFGLPKEEPAPSRKAVPTVPKPLSRGLSCHSGGAEGSAPPRSCVLGHLKFISGRLELNWDTLRPFSGRFAGPSHALPSTRDAGEGFPCGEGRFRDGRMALRAPRAGFRDAPACRRETPSDSAGSPRAVSRAISISLSPAVARPLLLDQLDLEALISFRFVYNRQEAGKERGCARLSRGAPEIGLMTTLQLEITGSTRRTQ